MDLKLYEVDDSGYQTFVDIKEEMVAALLDPRVQECHAKIFETILTKERDREESPNVGSEEAARMLGLKCGSRRLLIRALHTRVGRDPELAALKKKLGRWVVFDRAALEDYIQTHTKGGSNG